MVPVEVQAFGLLAVCVLALAALVFVQSLPRRLPWPIALIVCAVVAVLALVVLVSTGRP
jgi:cobalamin synthase